MRAFSPCQHTLKQTVLRMLPTLNFHLYCFMRDAKRVPLHRVQHSLLQVTMHLKTISQTSYLCGFEEPQHVFSSCSQVHSLDRQATGTRAVFDCLML